jgi:hypothetical protein
LNNERFEKNRKRIEAERNLEEQINREMLDLELFIEGEERCYQEDVKRMDDDGKPWL